MNPFYIVGLLLLVVISLVINAKAAVWTLWIPIAIALVAQFTIFRVTAHLNLDHAEPINGARRRWLIRTILRAPVFFILFVYFFAIALTPSRIWAWYTSPIVVSHSEVLVALSLIAATGWSGSLIAFSISKMTPSLYKGLRFFVYACFTPLITLVANAAVLRTLAFPVALLWGLLTFFQLRALKYTWKVEANIDVKVSGDEEVPPDVQAYIEMEAEKKKTQIQTYYSDWANDLLLGWQWSALLFSGAIIVFAFASEWATCTACLLALFAGFNLTIKSLRDPRAQRH